MFVMKHDGTYYMYAEGKNDVAHMLTSPDGMNWEEQGDLRMHMQNGDSIPGPYGTPTVWIENGHWYLFYERDDNGIWLAESKDHITWTNIQDEPVIKKGPGKYDAGALAANQVIKYKGRYYLYYHGSTNPDWADPEFQCPMDFQCGHVDRPCPLDQISRESHCSRRSFQPDPGMGRKQVPACTPCMTRYGCIFRKNEDAAHESGRRLFMKTIHAIQKYQTRCDKSHDR